MAHILDPADFGRPGLRSESAVLLERARLTRRTARTAAREYAHLAPPVRDGRVTAMDTPRSLEALGQLRNAIRGYAAALHDLEVPPGRALRLVKEAVIEVEIIRPVDAHAVADEVVRWFVEVYYGN